MLHPYIGRQADRRERDAQAIKAFEAGVATISEEMEQRVLEASYALREGLEEAEQAVATVREELGVDDRLVQGDMAYVEVVFILVLQAAEPFLVTLSSSRAKMVSPTRCSTRSTWLTNCGERP